jgi:hypothetical protein
MSFQMRYQDHDVEGQEARRFAELILKAIQPAYPEYVSADGDAYDYGAQYEVVLTVNTGERRKLRFKMREKPTAILASIAFMHRYHSSDANLQQSVVDGKPTEEILAPLPPEPKRKPGRPKKVKYVDKV